MAVKKKKAVSAAEEKMSTEEKKLYLDHKEAAAKSEYAKRIEVRGPYQFRVRYRGKGYPPKTLGTFEYLESAEQACRDYQSIKFEKGKTGLDDVVNQRNEAEKTTFGDVLDSELQKVIAKHHDPDHGDANRIRAMKKCAYLCEATIATLRANHFEEYIEDRRDMGLVESTIHREMTQLQGIVSRARKRWPHVLDKNYASTSEVEWPDNSSRRSRRLREGEEKKLRDVMDAGRVSAYMKPMFEIAITLGMRQSEIRNMEWKDVNFTQGYIYIGKTKTKIPRSVPLVFGMQKMLKAWKKMKQAEAKELNIKLPSYVFWYIHQNTKEVVPVTKNAVRLAFDKLRIRAGIKQEPIYVMIKGRGGKLVKKMREDKDGNKVACKKGNPDNLHFHDLRHEATSRLFERHGLSQIEVMSITGHRTAAMNERYTHLRAQDLAKKMDETGAIVSFPLAADEFEWLSMQSKIDGIPAEDVLKRLLRMSMHGALVPAEAA